MELHHNPGEMKEKSCSDCQNSDASLHLTKYTKGNAVYCKHPKIIADMRLDPKMVIGVPALIKDAKECPYYQEKTKQ